MKKKTIADELLNSLEEAVQMESGELKGRETFRKFLVQHLSGPKKVLRNFVLKFFT